MANKPEIRVGHRFGNVFLRLIKKTRLGRESHLARLSPEEAEKLGNELVRLAGRAKPKLKIKG